MTSNRSYIDDDNAEVDSSIKEIDHVSSHIPESTSANRSANATNYIIIVVLFMINLLNYIDRFTITGVLPEIQKYYDYNDAEGGLLQTSFIITYMLCSPLFGYLGDRFNRKWMIIAGVTFWSSLTLASSFVPSHMKWLFVVMRSLVGIGEASYSTVAPTIISDLFKDDSRTKVMAFFYFAVPIGSGSGFIIGQGLFNLFKTWQAALRFTPIIGIICVILLVILVKEPERGQSEGGTHLAASPWREDIRQLTKNRSFMLITFGSTAVNFVIGSVTWFAVKYINYGIVAEKQQADADKNSNVEFIFGGMTILAGILGVVIGAECGRRLRKISLSADPLVCAFGLIVAAPFFLVSLVLAKYHLKWTLATIFITQLFLCLNWALIVDMTMGTVIPSRRATATAYQMILSHAFGDAGSPYIIGSIKDSICNSMTKHIDKFNANYYSMQYALLLDSIISVIGGFLFVWTSFFIASDKANVQKIIKESQFHYETVGTSYQPEDSQISNSPSLNPTSCQHII